MMRLISCPQVIKVQCIWQEIGGRVYHAASHKKFDIAKNDRELENRARVGLLLEVQD